MPSIEIICVGQTKPTDFGDLPFAVVAESKLVSHRKPSLFQKNFSQLKGCIYHLGNADLKKDSNGRVFFAYDLLGKRCTDESPSCHLQFKKKFAVSIRRMITRLLRASPIGKIYFTSDWQFGPQQPKRFKAIGESQFWKLHDTFGLRMNSLYQIIKQHDSPRKTTSLRRSGKNK